jgi:two-component system phosphate regulon response regulator PhoB
MGRSILLVDDEPYILRILSFKLRREGFSTHEAVSAEEAEEVLAQNHIDLILLDVGLATPTSGFDLALKLRSQSCTRDIPIIMLTARSFAKDVLRGREVGAAGYITKPFSTSEVIQRVRALLSPS